MNFHNNTKLKPINSQSITQSLKRVVSFANFLFQDAVEILVWGIGTKFNVLQKHLLSVVRF